MKTVGELRAALADLADEAEFLVCVQDSSGEDGYVMVDPGETREMKVLRPDEPGWPFGADDPDAPPAMAYLMVGEWGS